MAKMDDREIIGIVRAEEDDAISYYTSEIVAEQEKALGYYYADPFGDEVEGRSSVVSHDVAETIDWLIPDIMRVFVSGDEVVKYEPRTQNDEPFAKQATEYANYVFFTDNDGVGILHDWAKDGLLQKLGVVRVDWDDTPITSTKAYTGLNSMQLLELQAETLPPGYVREIVEFSEEEVEPSEQYPDGMRYDVRVETRDEIGRVVIQNVPPEEFLVSRRERDLKRPRYCAHRTRKTLSELKEMFPDKRRVIDELGSEDDDAFDTRQLERWRDEDYDLERGHESSDQSQREVVFVDEYVVADFDGKGVAQLWNVQRVASTILEKQKVEDNPFAAWCPVRMPHKLYGLSVADQVLDIQRVKSVLWRGALDSVYQATSPRIGADTNRVNLDDLLVVRPGGVIRTEGAPGESLMPIVTPDMAGSAYQMLEYVDQEREGRTGVTRHAQGLDPNSLNKTATGINLLQQASSSRKELISRMLAMGVEQLFRKLLRVMVDNQQAPRLIRLRDEWVPMQPSAWSATMDVSVHVGLGTGSRDAQLQHLLLLTQKQEQILMTAGPNNPVAGMKEYYNSLARMTEVMGFRSPEPFFLDPESEEAQQRMQNAPPPEPDPAMAKIEADMQAKQAELQMKGQESQAEHQRKMEEAIAELQLKREQIMAELDLKREELAAELQLKREEMDRTFALKAREAEMNAQIRREAARATAESRPGQ